MRYDCSSCMVYCTLTAGTPLITIEVMVAIEALGDRKVSIS